MDYKNESNSETSPVNNKLVVSQKIDHPRIFKVIVIGDSNVGKTTLTYRFCEGNFLEKAEATIGVDFRSRTINIDGEDITLQLWDTAGQERFRMSMIRHYYRNTHAIVFVYDVTDPATFDNLKKWIEESNLNSLSNVPKILVGNKCDGIVKVTTNVAQKFADQNNMPLFETSARLDSQCDNVEAIFITLAHKLKYSKPFMVFTDATVDVRQKVSKDEPKKSGRCC